MRLPCIAALALALGLSACGTGSFGDPADGFAFPRIEQSYVPLHGSDWALISLNGAAVVIAPGIAVACAHEANMIDDDAVIGKVSDYDLMYFRTKGRVSLKTSVPFDGEEVVAYGQGTDGKLRVSHGVVRQFWPAAFGYFSDAGAGFSGGPVVDAKTGALLGITYQYQSRDDPKNHLVYAYNMAFVMDRLAAVQSRPAPQ